MINKLLPLMLILCFVPSCRSFDWKKVSKQNTIASYETFLKKYPSGSYSKEARQAIMVLAWDVARDKGSVDAYSNFIKEYPESEFNRVARRLGDEKGFKNAEEKNTVKAYQDFIRENPKSRHLKKAAKKIEELSWEKAKKSDSVKGYEQFINTNQNSSYKSKADDRKNKLGLREFEIVSFKEAEQENSLESYRGFLEIYPRGVYAEKSIQLLIPLLPGLMERRVKDLISKNSLARARGILTLRDYETDDLLLISTILINTLDDKTPIHPKGRVWEKSTTIGDEVKKVFQSMGQRALPPLNFALLLGGYLNSRYSDEVRVKIVEILELIRDREAIYPLIDLLEITDVHYTVKLEAIKALLSVFKEPDAEELSLALLKRFLTHEDETVRWATIEKLSEINSPVILSPLISSLSDKNLRLHAEKIRVLGATGDSRAVNPLIEILTSTDNSKAKIVAADGLILIGDRLALRPFLRLLKSDVRPSLRRKAVKGLVKLYDPERDENLTSEFILLSNDPDQFIRVKAEEALVRAEINGEPPPEQ